MHRPVRSLFLFATTAALPLAMARADEGMWTFDAFPAARMQAAYGWAPDQAWLDRVRAPGGPTAALGQFSCRTGTDPHQHHACTFLQTVDRNRDAKLAS